MNKRNQNWLFKWFCLFLVVSSSASLLFAQSFQVGRNGAVTSASRLASEIGIQILQAGGNAVDAAVAVGFALAVVYPEAGNIGGGGFMLIRTPDGQATVIDYREKAPEAASTGMYLDEKGEVVPNLSTIGPLAAGVPGSVRGYELAWRKFGSLTWQRLVTPAAELARRGYPVTYIQSRSLEAVRPIMMRFPASQAMFFPDGKIPEVGTVVKYPDLARTLERIARHGPDEFYTGQIASLLVANIQKEGGIISLADLRNYQAVERAPLSFTYRDYTIISAPPPSSGGICLAQILKILERYPLSKYGFMSSQVIQLMVEAERRVYANRAHFLGDPDFVNVPIAALLDSTIINQMVQTIDSSRATPSNQVSHVLLSESEETTHFSVVDRNGMAVANTTTLNTSYGSCFVADKTGILLNNEMDDFAIKPGFTNVYGLIGSEANAIKPGKRMLSSMTPTIVTYHDSLRYVLGTPGGATIITTLTQLIVNLVDFRMDLMHAVAAPRFHHQWLPDELMVEHYAFPPDLQQILMARGYHIVERDAIGDVNAIAVDYRRGYYFAVPDWRRQSAAVAY